ncbi:MAG: class I tRNA ligase family protein [Candidatus Azambacteria bacterium]|nr:class I tRNA ligase family protein [Candidatus Azambacteria bacterium]
MSRELKFKLKPNQKLKTKNGEFKTGDNAYIISWTTTPWTLPGNIALAIGEKINYEILKLENGEVFIFAKDLKEGITEKPKFKSDFVSGKNLVGLEYKPLFDIPQLKSKASYKIYPADFVNTGEGTGVVHIAPMYGVDDFNLGAKAGLPKIHTVDLNGKFSGDFGAGLKGLAVKSVETERLIAEHLKSKGNLLKIKKYEHDYPFCWRCHSPLLYYAKSSWFIRMEKLRKKLLDNNKKINWVPSHIKNGRFGEWLNEVKDWAFSRERYWGTPLPVWACDKCGKYKVIGSIGELKKEAVKSGNNYFLMRHGFAEHNLTDVINSNIKNNGYKLTPKGRQDILKNAQKLKKQKIDMILASDFTRTKETAEIVAAAVGIPKGKIIFDKRLREINMGDLEGKSSKDYHTRFSLYAEMFFKRLPNGENLTELKNRVTQVLYELENKYQNKNILIVSHEYPIWMLVAGANGLTNEESIKIKEKKDNFIKTAEVQKLNFVVLPHDKNFIFDLHRPYIDKIELKCDKCPGVMKRVKDVVDVWFDSGAMPFAQYHWPFDKKLEYPADFISEGVDQTRGWFYTLHAVGTLMGKGPAFKNVICLGHILDEKGEKMSKSKGNVIDPREIIDKYGIDALRWYFFTINPPGETKRFIIHDVEERLRRFVLTLSNVLIFYKTYATKIMTKKSSLSLLDKWILSRLNQTIKIVRNNLDKYEVTQAARPIDEFVDDLSRWWLRRSRKRFSDEDGKNTSAVLRVALEELSKLIAPFTPFLAEHIWQGLDNKSSVHLTDYPKPQIKLIDKKLEEQMNFTREIAAKGLALRAEAGIKVRQPLSKLQIPNHKTQISNKLLELIKEEVNVKEIVLGDEFKIDTKITAELKEEGIIRELTRQIQDMRKDGGLISRDSIKLYFKIDYAGLKDIVERWQENISNEVGARKIEFVGSVKDGLLVDRHFKVEDKDVWIGIIKIR